MKKTDAIAIFGNAASLARAVGLSRGRISQWPEKLEQKQQDLVVGAAVRLGKVHPCDQSGIREQKRARA